MTATPRTGLPHARPAHPASPPSTGHHALLVGTRVLLALFGALKLGATVYFTFFASAAAGGDPQGAGDWSVAGWSILMGAGYLGLAALLGRRRVLAPAIALTAADLAFSVVKLTVYRETPSLVFMAVSLVLLGLVVLTGRTRRN